MSDPFANPPLSAQRLWGFILRHWYLTRGSGARLLELVYWPTVQMCMWGFLQTYLADKSSLFATGAGTLIGGVLLWDVLFRGQIGLSIAFLEEVWSRNLGHLMVTPMRTWEFVTGLITASLFKTLIGLVPTSILAIWFFGFNIYGLGIALVFLFFNLMVFGWSIGIMVAGIILRFGQGAETLAWALTFAIAPLCGVYYPAREVLPDWLIPIANILSPSYIFDGMRSILLDQRVTPDMLIKPLLLNVVTVAIGVSVFVWLLRQARVNAKLLQIGE